MNSKTETGKIGRVSLAVEIDGKCCFVVLPQDRLRIVVNLAGALSDDSKLHVVEPPEGFKFNSLEYHCDQDAEKK